MSKLKLFINTIKNSKFVVKYKKYFPIIVFLIAAFFVFSFLRFEENLPKRPRSIHAWAQCMRASVAKNYAEESMNFFLPRLHNTLGGEGITGLEFPFINYSVAILYKVFGFNEAYFRGFVCLSMFIGLGFFFFMSYSLLKNIFISLLVVGLCFFSPVLVYYTTNFMPDVTSLGLVLVGWCLFFKYLTTHKTKLIYWLCFVFTLATLIKITSFIAFGVIVCILILDKLKFFNKTNNTTALIKHKKQFIISMIVGTTAVVGWYVYAQWLSTTYNSNAFTLGTVSPKSKEEFFEVWEAIKINWIADYYNPDFYWVMFWILISLVVFFKFVNRLLFTIFLFTTLGSFAFAMLMFLQFMAHDYYIIPLLPSIFFLIITFFDMVKRVSDRYFKGIQYIVAISFSYFLINNAIYSREHYTYRQSDYYLEVMGDDIRNYYDMETVLRSLGIKKHDITLAGPDPSFSNALYLMNQVGYQFNDYSNVDFIKSVMEDVKPKVLIVKDTAAFNKAFPNDLKNQIIGVHNGLTIYKLY